MTEPGSDRFKLLVLGTPDLRAPDGRRITSVLSQPKRLGLLTYLALSQAPVSRAAVVALFWPDSHEARARNALSQAVFHLRRSMAEEVVQGVEGDRLWAPPELIWCDARELLTTDEPAAEVLGAAARGFLEGWNADDSQPLQEWLDTQRRRVRDRAARPAPHPTATDEPSLTHEPPVSIPTPRRTRLASLAFVGVAAVAVVLAAGRLLGDRPAAAEIAVLMPRVLAVPGAAELSPQTVLDEVLAHLPDRDDLRVVPAASATSVPEFRTQLSAIGTPVQDAPEWILEVSVRVTSTEVRVIGLLYRSPGFDVPGRESFGVSYVGAESMLLDVPRAIAMGVADMVARVLATTMLSAMGSVGATLC